MGRFYQVVDSYTRSVPCEKCSAAKEEKVIEVKECKEPFGLREDFDKDVCVEWK